MKTEEVTITQFANMFAETDFRIFSSYYRLIKLVWFDWWCRDSSLRPKTENLGKKVYSILQSKKFDPDQTYVFFKNNCPAVGPLYDQFSICDIKSGDVLYCVQHLERGSHGCDKAHWEVYEAPVFDTPAITGTWDECKKWFNQK